MSLINDALKRTQHLRSVGDTSQPVPPGTSSPGDNPVPPHHNRPGKPPLGWIIFSASLVLMFVTGFLLFLEKREPGAGQPAPIAALAGPPPPADASAPPLEPKDAEGNGLTAQPPEIEIRADPAPPALPAALPAREVEPPPALAERPRSAAPAEAPLPEKEKKVPPVPSARIQDFVNQLDFNAVMAGGPTPRAWLEGRVHHLQDNIGGEFPLVLVGIHPNHLLLQASDGVVYRRDF